jgi:hypothetical protein
VGAVQRQEDVVDRPAGRVDPDQLSADGQLPVQDPELDALPVHERADLGAALQQDLRRLDRLTGQDRLRAGLDDARLLGGDLGQRVAQQVRVVDVDRRHHGHVRVRDVGGVPGAAQPDLDHRHVDRGVGERRVRHGRDDLEEGHRHPVELLLVDQCHVRLDLTPGLVEPLVGDGQPVDGDPLGHAHHVRAGEPPGAEARRPQQRLDHRGRAALAVRPGHVDDRVGALRIAEQGGEGADPGQARRHPVLGPAPSQGGDDLAVR